MLIRFASTRQRFHSVTKLYYYGSNYGSKVQINDQAFRSEPQRIVELLRRREVRQRYYGSEAQRWYDDAIMVARRRSTTTLSVARRRSQKYVDASKVARRSRGTTTLLR